MNCGAGGAGGAFIHERHLSKLPAVHGWWGNDVRTKFDMKRGQVDSVEIRKHSPCNLPTQPDCDYSFIDYIFPQPFNHHSHLHIFICFHHPRIIPLPNSSGWNFPSYWLVKKYSILFFLYPVDFEPVPYSADSYKQSNCPPLLIAPMMASLDMFERAGKDARYRKQRIITGST